MNKKNFVAQAGILAAAGIICRIIGFLYRSPLTAVIGDEGNGYYSSAYNMYVIILLIASYSIPSAVSKIISGKLALKQYKNAMRVFRCAIIYVVVVGGICALLAFTFASALVPDNAVIVMRVFAPTIFFSGLLGTLRGYFQSQGNMVPTSLSQIIEQILNAAVSIGAAYLFISWVEGATGTTRAVMGAAGSAVGTGVGVVTGLIFMLCIFFPNRKEMKKLELEDMDESAEGYREIYREIFTIVTPIIMSTFVYNLCTPLNQNIYQRILMHVKNISQVQVVTQYGIFAGKPVIISNIPIALAASMSSALIPVISAAYAKKEQDRLESRIKNAIRVTMRVAIPSAVAFIFLARPITEFLFPQKESLNEASILLATIGITVVFYALSTVSNGVLQATGKVREPLKNAVIALIIQALILVGLLLTTNFGVYSLSISMIIYSFLMCVLNSASIRKHLGYRQEYYQTFFLPALAALITGVESKVLYEILIKYIGSNRITLVIVMTIALFVNEASLLAMGGIKEENLNAIPGGHKLAKLLFRKKK